MTTKSCTLTSSRAANVEKPTKQLANPTGSHIEKAGLEVTKYKSGPLGGDAQIGGLVAEGKIDAVFFFRDPLDKHPHEPDIAMLMRLCDVYNVPLATNPAGARLILGGISDE